MHNKYSLMIGIFKNSVKQMVKWTLDIFIWWWF